MTERMAEDPLELHRDATVVDAHNDLLMLVARRPPHRWADYFRRNWLPQLRQGGVDVQVLPVFVDREFRPEGALRETLRMIEAAHKVADQNADAVALCRGGADIGRALTSDRIALVLALEGCPGIDEDIELFETMFRLGVRICSFAHLGRSALADGSAEDAAGSRLTRRGVEALTEVQRLGMLFDISHLGAAGVDHVLELTDRPVIATHSSARAVRDHHRNLGDHQIRMIADLHGVVCVNFFPGLVHPDDHSVARVVDHIVHIAAVAGVEAVGIGPDFIHEVAVEKHSAPWCDPSVNGLDMHATIPGLEGPAGLPSVTAELLTRGFSEHETSLILGGNALRLFNAELGVPADVNADSVNAGPGSGRSPARALGEAD